MESISCYYYMYDVKKANQNWGLQLQVITILVIIIPILWHAIVYKQEPKTVINVNANAYDWPHLESPEGT